MKVEKAELFADDAVRSEAQVVLSATKEEREELVRALEVVSACRRLVEEATAPLFRPGMDWAMYQYEVWGEIILVKVEEGGCG